MRRKFTFSLLSLTLIMYLTACGQGKAAPTSTPIPTDTPIPTPTFTPTPSAPLAILVIPADFDQTNSNLYQKTVYDLAQQSGFRFQVRNSLSEADLDPALRMVVALPPDPGPGIAALAAAAPQAQFLAIDIPGVTAGGNISVLAQNSNTDIVAFMAGFIGAMITDDYRIGMLIPADNADALSALDAYTNGMAYFCGTCQGLYYYNDDYGNAIDFPRALPIPADESAANYGGYAVYLIQHLKVNYIYTYPDLATPELLSFIGTQGAVQMGVAPDGGLPIYWVASLSRDVPNAIQATWPGLIAGQGGQVVESPLTFTNVDPSLLPPGKQTQAEQVLADLLTGRLLPHGVP